MSAVQLNTTASAPAPSLEAVSANAAQPGGFADALAAEQAAAPAQTTPLGLPVAEHGDRPGSEPAAPSPDLLALLAADTGLPPAPVLPGPPSLSLVPSLPGAAASPMAATALEEGPAAEDEGTPALDAQTSYALAALGLWQPPAEAAAMAAAPAVPRAEARASAALNFAAAFGADEARPAVPAAASTLPVAGAATGEAAAAAELPVDGLVVSTSKPPATPLAVADSLPNMPSPNPISLRSAAPFALPTDAAASTLRLPNGEPSQWQQPLLLALGDRLQLQIATRSEQAVIRLEPPLMGRVEIAIRQQAGELQVRLSATHVEVTRQLQQVSEGLRQELAQRHSGDVTVQVAQGGRDAGDARPFGRDAQSQQQAQQEQQEGREQQQRRPGRALSDDEGGPARFAAALAGTSLS